MARGLSGARPATSPSSSFNPAMSSSGARPASRSSPPPSASRVRGDRSSLSAPRRSVCHSLDAEERVMRLRPCLSIAVVVLCAHAAVSGSSPTPSASVDVAPSRGFFNDGASRAFPPSPRLPPAVPPRPPWRVSSPARRRRRRRAPCRRRRRLRVVRGHALCLLPAAPPPPPATRRAGRPGHVLHVRLHAGRHTTEPSARLTRS